MKTHESPRIRKNHFVAIRAIRGLCGIGVLHVLKRSLGVYPTHPLWKVMALFNQLVFQFGKGRGWEGIRSCTHKPRLSKGWSIGDGPGPRRPVKGYDMISWQQFLAILEALSCRKKKLFPTV